MAAPSDTREIRASSWWYSSEERELSATIMCSPVLSASRGARTRGRRGVARLAIASISSRHSKHPPLAAVISASEVSVSFAACTETLRSVVCFFIRAFSPTHHQVFTPHMRMRICTVTHVTCHLIHTPARAAATRCAAPKGVHVSMRGRSKVK